MILGTSQVDITPKPGVELSGFAARVQPSTRVHDPLFAKGLYLVSGDTRLLWIHCDLIGFDRSIVTAFRRWAGEALGLKPGQVMLSATHTHAGPCTIHLCEAGEFDLVYGEFLQQKLREAVGIAMAQTEAVELVTAEGHLDLAVDRRKTASSHTDPRVGVLGFRRADGTFAAVIVNYAMHPVALGPKNCEISADMPGAAASRLAEQLAGNPVVLITNGASANLNPPAENVTFEQAQAWGSQIAETARPLLSRAQPQMPRLRVLRQAVPLPLDALDATGINRFADKALTNAAPLAEWGDKYRRVVEHWRQAVLQQVAEHRNPCHDAELFGVLLGDVILLGANAEVFSQFTEMLQWHGSRRIYLVSYANGDLGYLPPRTAYAEGGYEVEVAHMFYGGFRPKEGGLELLAANASRLLAQLTSAPEPGVAQPAKAQPSATLPGAAARR